MSLMGRRRLVAEKDNSKDRNNDGDCKTGYRTCWRTKPKDRKDQARRQRKAAPLNHDIDGAICRSLLVDVHLAAVVI